MSGWDLTADNVRVVPLGRFRRIPATSQVPVQIVGRLEAARRGLRWTRFWERAGSALVAAIVVVTLAEAVSGRRGFIAALAVAAVLQWAGANLYRRWGVGGGEPFILEGRLDPDGRAVLEEEIGLSIAAGPQPLAIRLTASPGGGVRVSLDWFDRGDRRSGSGRHVEPFDRPIATTETPDQLWRLVADGTGRVVNAQIVGTRSTGTLGEVSGRIGRLEQP